MAPTSEMLDIDACLAKAPNAEVVRTCAPVSCGPNHATSTVSEIGSPGLWCGSADALRELVGSSASRISMGLISSQSDEFLTSAALVRCQSCHKPRSEAAAVQAVSSSGVACDGSNSPTRSLTSMANTVTGPVGAAARTKEVSPTGTLARTMLTDAIR